MPVSKLRLDSYRSLATVPTFAAMAGIGIEAGAVPGPVPGPGASGLFGLAADASGIRRKRKA